MDSFRKWFYKPKRDDKSLLAQFFYADDDLNMIANELDSFDGRKDPERCTTLVNLMRQSQDRVLSITNAIMDVLIPNERANRDFRVKFPEDVLQENLAGQLWFGAECLAAGSCIMNREVESVAMRPLAKALTKSLTNVRNLLREACLKNNRPNGPLCLPNNEFISESLKIFDRLFAEFELRYVSAMVPVKSTQEYELQELIGVLFSETLQRALKMKLLTQEQVDDCDPALMFTIPRLAIVSGLLIYPNGPLCIDKPIEQMSEMFRPFKTLLQKIRELLWTLNKCELYMLEKLLCDNEQISDIQPSRDMSSENLGDLDEFVNRFYNDYPLCKDFVSSFYTVSINDSDQEADYANEASESSVRVFSSEKAAKLLEPEDSQEQYPDYETISDISLSTIDNVTAIYNSLESQLFPSQQNESSREMYTDSSSLEQNVSYDKDVEYCSRHSPESTHNSNNDESDVKKDRHTSENIEIPSTSGYLLANAVGHDEILASMSTPDQSQERVESLPDQDPLEMMSAATATLSTLLLNRNQSEQSVLRHEFEKHEVKDDCLFCEEMKNKIPATKCENPKNGSDSPLDSGISTETTSLDRSPSFDLSSPTDVKKDNVDCKNENLSTCSFNNDDSNKDNILDSIPNLNVTRINCQCRNVDENSVINIQINYSEMGVTKNETCDNFTLKINDESRTNMKTVNDISPSTSKKYITSSPPTNTKTNNITPRHKKKSHQQRFITNKDKIIETPDDNLSVCSSETSSFNSECADDEEIALAMQAAEIANRNEVRAKFRSSEDLVHRLFVCIAGVADQLQTNFASDLRNILKSVFLMNASDNNPQPTVSDSYSIEYQVSESEITRNDEFSNDPNIIAEEALYESNIYIETDENGESSYTGHINNDLENNRENETHLNRDDLGETSHQNRVNSTSFNEDVPPIWIPDVQAPRCMSCEANFTVVKRRHHCRNCGKVFCARCSANSVPLPKYGHNKPVRVCNKCFMYQLTPFTM